MTHNNEGRGPRFGIFAKLLILLVLISLLPLLVVWFLNYQSTLNQVREAAQERLEATSNLLATHVADWIEMNSRMLRENAASPSMRSMDPEVQRPILRLTKDEYPWIHSMLVIAPDGNSISRSDELPLKNYSDRRYVQQVLAGEPMGQQVLIGKTTGLPGLALAVPIEGAHGEVSGMLVASMATALISSYLTNVQIGETGYAFLLDRDGKVIAHQHLQDETFRKDFSGHPAFAAYRKEGKSRLIFADAERETTAIAYMKGMEDGWTLVVQQDYDEVFEIIGSTNRSALLTLLVTLPVVLIVSVVLSKRLTRPIRRLTAMANEASMANFDALNADIPGHDRRDEVGELTRSVERLAVSLRVALGRLQRLQH
jgi:methyl-accepting chemotaxis protein